jgi:hypothetical protein
MRKVKIVIWSEVTEDITEENALKIEEFVVSVIGNVKKRKIVYAK